MSLITLRIFKTFKKNVVLTQLIVFASLVCLISEVSAQNWTSETLTRGKLWSSINNSLRKGSSGLEINTVSHFMDYPGYSKAGDFDNALNYIQGGGIAVYGERDGIAQAYTTTTVFYASGQYVTPIDDEELFQNYNFTDPSMAS